MLNSKQNLKAETKNMGKGLKEKEDRIPKQNRKDWWKTNLNIYYFDGGLFMKQKQRNKTNKQNEKATKQNKANNKERGKKEKNKRVLERYRERESDRERESEKRGGKIAKDKQRETLQNKQLY